MQLTQPTGSTATVGMSPGERKNKRIPIMIATVISLGILAGAFYLIHSGLGEGNAEALAPAQIQVTDGGFSPATVRVKKGQQLTWVNTDEQSHQVAGDTQIEPALQYTTKLNPGDTATITLEHIGTFDYHDALSTSDFKGTIIVE